MLTRHCTNEISWTICRQSCVLETLDTFRNPSKSWNEHWSLTPHFIVSDVSSACLRSRHRLWGGTRRSFVWDTKGKHKRLETDTNPSRTPGGEAELPGWGAQMAFGSHISITVGLRSWHFKRQTSPFPKLSVKETGKNVSKRGLCCRMSDRLKICGPFSCQCGKPPFQAEEQCDQETWVRQLAILWLSEWGCYKPSTNDKNK